MNIDQIAMYYQSVALARQTLETYGKIFVKFQFCFQIIDLKPKKYSNHINIDQSVIYYRSMDFTRQALKTNGRLFFSFRYNFSN